MFSEPVQVQVVPGGLSGAPPAQGDWAKLGAELGTGCCSVCMSSPGDLHCIPPP